MMKKAWRTLAAVGLVTSVGLVGCVVGSSDDDGTGGSSGSGGSSTGGTGGGPTGGTGGATGGTGGGSTGGSSGGYACEPADGGTQGTPGSCKAQNATDPCEVCVETKCCTEWEACVATGPGNPCGFGGPTDGDDKGEIDCFQACYIAELKKGTDPNDAKGTCGGQCATPSCGTIAGATSELVACLDKDCLDECFPTK